jgi:(p)ppGpp synthase/HD superfamily hydrolase
MFRHQLDTMATLIDYGYIDSVLLKASVIHDLLEDVAGFNHNLILSTDFEGPQVYDLVMEVTRFPNETKPEFLTRIRKSGSREAKILKVADRISNMISLGFVINVEFISRYTEETVKYIIPIADEVDKAMGAELGSLAESRRMYVSVFAGQDDRND